MKKYTKPEIPNPSKYIFTEGINYSNTGKKSIWGKGDQATLGFLKHYHIEGNWLNVAAGDGRYSKELLKKANSLIVIDFDIGALSKLWFNLIKSQRNRIKCKKCNIVQKLPFKKNSFDGLFCTGILHLFPKQILIKKIFPEFKRVVKNNGIIIIDFATNIQRRYPNGKLHWSYKNEPRYDLIGSKMWLKKEFPKIETLITSEVKDDLTKIKNIGYNFYCKFVLLTAKNIKS